MAQQPMHGYDDTPHLPGSRWRIHDHQRPRPPKIDPGTAGTPAAPGRPPSDASVLFDGTDLSQWRNGDGGAAAWTVENGYMEVAADTGDIWTRERFADCQLHLEWAAPVEVHGEGQGRGNSGVFLMDIYEIQVLDSWDNPTYADGHAAALYAQKPPMVNASRPPGEWQSFDIFFLAPHYDGDRLTRPAYLTLIHNGVLVHLQWELLGHTYHRTAPVYDPAHGTEGPIRLQNHGGDRVRYRNVWIRTLTDYGPE